MRCQLAVLACAVLLLGAASAPLPEDWQRGTERLAVFHEHLENGTLSPHSESAVYAEGAVRCTKEEFRDKILAAVPGFVFRKTRFVTGEYDGLLFEEAEGYAGMANASFVRVDEGMLDGRKAVIVSHGFFHLHYAKDGRVTSCAAYLQPGTPQ